MKRLIFIMALIVCVMIVDAQNQPLKKVTTNKELCDLILKYNINDVLEDDISFLKKQGFDPQSVVEYAMNHPEAILECLFNLTIDLSQNEPTLKVAGFNWALRKYSGNLSVGWVKISLSEIKMINETEAIATITLKNTKSIYMLLTNSGGSGYMNSLGNGILLYPQEQITFPDKLKFQPDCDLINTYKVNFEFNFSRGELTGCTFQEMVTRLALSVGAPLPLKPFAFYGLNIGYSNQAVYNSVLNIFWTAVTGEWLKRDQIENAINLLNLYDLFDLCPECKTIWEIDFFKNYTTGEFSPELLSILYQKGIDPQTGLSLFLKTFIKMLENPVTRDLAYEVAKKFLPSALTQGGAAVLAANLSVIVTGGWRVMALAPIAWDVWNTQKVEDISGVEISPVCIVAY